MLRNKIERYNVNEVAKKLDIPRSTIYRWINLQNIDNTVKFMEFLRYLNIDYNEFINWYKKKDT